MNKTTKQGTNMQSRLAEIFLIVRNALPTVGAVYHNYFGGSDTLMLVAMVVLSLSLFVYVVTTVFAALHVVMFEGKDYSNQRARADNWALITNGYLLSKTWCVWASDYFMRVFAPFVALVSCSTNSNVNFIIGVFFFVVVFVDWAWEKKLFNIVARRILNVQYAIAICSMKSETPERFPYYLLQIEQGDTDELEKLFQKIDTGEVDLFRQDQL